MSSIRSVTALALVSASYAFQPIVAPTGLRTLTVGILGDYGWTGWMPAPSNFCQNVLPRLQALNIAVPTELVNDCDPGDTAAINNATAFQEDTAKFINQVCTTKECTAFISVGDNFYDSGVDFTTTGVLRFEEAWVNLYSGGVFDKAPWYQCLGNHDVVVGQAGVDFQTKIAPLYDERWYFGTEQLPWYTYDLTGADWTATVVVVDSDCFINKYQKPSSVYYTPYTIACHQTTQQQVDFLAQSFAQSKADWKILQIHHPYISSSSNYTELQPLIDIVQQHNAVVLNGHDHCMGHYYYEGINYVLSGGAGYPEAGDCNNGVKLGPFAKFLGATEVGVANGFVVMDISKNELNFDYYLRDMTYEGGDLYPVRDDTRPRYSFKVTEKAK